MSLSRTMLSSIVVGLAGLISQPALSQHSVARQWDETMLDSIKRDRVRPPVQARNLFHMSVAMYDAWAAYDPAIRPYFFEEKISAKNIAAARSDSISTAMWNSLITFSSGCGHVQSP